MSYKGIYDRTIFYNPDTRFSIISVKTNDTSVPAHVRNSYKYRDHLIRFTASGFALPQSDCVELELAGEWVNNEKYGYHLQVEQCREIVHRTVAGIKGYLSSGLLKGIGKATAEEIVSRFGVAALDILEHEPERFLEVRGITPERLTEIKESYAETHALRDLMAFLAPFEVGVKTAIKIQQTLGMNSISIIRQQPFELCRFPGFGFKKVDSIAQKMGVLPDDPTRVMGALQVCLNHLCEEKGHLFVSADTLCRSALMLLNKGLAPRAPRLKGEQIRPYLETLVLQGDVISYKDAIYSKRYFILEDETARRIAEILRSNEISEDLTQPMETVIQQLGITLSEKQRDAVKMALQHRLSIITGSPGTGKTTVLKTVIETYRKLHPEGKLLLAAPTGRASRNMAESTGFADAKTLHSALGLISDDEEDEYINENEDIDADFIVIDEFSMADMWLTAQIFRRLKPETRLLLVGDADQLPSVKPGNVFREMIACGLVPTTVLDRIFRQAEDSLIAKYAKYIKAGNDDIVFDDNEFQFMECEMQADVAATIQKVYLEETAKSGFDRVQILSPFLARGEASTVHLNQSIREIVNPCREEEAELQVGQRSYRAGDRIMQTKNKDKIFNGDVGYIRQIEHPPGGEVKVTVEFSDNRVKEYDIGKMKDLLLAYDITVHKAMGSEYSTIIMPMLVDHMVLLDNNLIYTAVTRAKKRVILVGEKDIFFLAIHRDNTSKRNTALGDRIKQYCRLFTIQQEIAEQNREPEQLKLTG